MRDVNKMLGWTIFDLRLKKIRMLNQLLVEDGTEKELYLRREINFLESMTFRKEEAISKDAAYTENCYDSYLMTWGDREEAHFGKPRIF